MKLNKIILAMLTSASLLAAASVQAEGDDPTPPADGGSTVTVQGGVVHFNGSLVNAACAVSTESANQTVNLGQYRTASFQSVGDTSATIPFKIVLNDCDTTVASTAKVAFSGQTEASDDTLLAINSGTNEATATGVGIEILDEDSSVMTPDGATFSKGHSLIDGTNTLNFAARYKATSAEPTPGQANADAVFTMQYN